MISEPTLVNGVFKGGGARGAAYAGALEAVEESGIWFHSVAGSSAGAVTASLIAAGYNADEIGGLTAGAFRASIGLRSLLSARLRFGIFSSGPLEKWLDMAIAAKCDQPAGAPPITFTQLYEMSERIDLFIVTLDLASGTPVVFSRHRTPDVTVSTAVVASCAIPGMFTPGRALVRHELGLAVHALIDGGAWANFPDFVFCDEEFRSWYGLATDTPSNESNTLGFVLGPRRIDGPPEIQGALSTSFGARLHDAGLGQTSKASLESALARTLGSWPARLALVIVFFLTSSLAAQSLPLGGPAIVAFVPLIPQSLKAAISFPLLVAVGASLGLLAGTALALAVFGGTLLRVVVPSFKAALGPATGVAPWKGHGKLRIIVVPATGLTTFSLRASPTALIKARNRAYQSVLAQLANSAVPEVDKTEAPSAKRGRVFSRIILYSLGMGFIVAGGNLMTLGYPNGDAWSGVVIIVFGLLLWGATSLMTAQSIHAETSARNLRPSFPDLAAGSGMLVLGLTLMVASITFAGWQDHSLATNATKAAIIAQTAIPSPRDPYMVCYRAYLLPRREPLTLNRFDPPSGNCREVTNGKTIIFRSDARLRTFSVVGVGSDQGGSYFLLPNAAPRQKALAIFGVLPGLLLIRLGIGKISYRIESNRLARNA